MIIDLCNDDIDQRKCPKKIPHKNLGGSYPNIVKNRNFLNHSKNVLELVQVVSRF